MKTSCFVLLTAGLLMQPFAFADVSYTETTQINGGSMVGMLKMAGAFSSQVRQLSQPSTTNVMIHGGRMVRANQHTTEIIDLDQQTMTSIDHDKRTYSTTTFQEFQQQMAKSTAQLKSQSQTNSGASQMSFSAHVSSNGATRQISGETAKESLLTVTMVSSAADNSAKAGMAATAEMWMVQDVAGLAELRAFNVRMAKELSIDVQASAMTSMLAAQPGGAEALAELKKESANLSGMPVLQVTRVGLTADGQPLPAPSVAALPSSQTQGKGTNTAAAVGQEVAVGTATQTAGNQIARLGTFGRALSGSSMGALMHHAPSPSATPAPAAGATAADAATAGVLLESQTQSSGFSTAAVDTNGFGIPAGYKAVASPMAHK